MNLRKEIPDQGAHAFAAFAFVILARLMGAEIPPHAGAWIGFTLGLVREITEEGAINLEALKGALGSRLDLTFWTLGGGLAGLPPV